MRATTMLLGLLLAASVSARVPTVTLSEMQELASHCGDVAAWHDKERVWLPDFLKAAAYGGASEGQLAMVKSAWESGVANSQAQKYKGVPLKERIDYLIAGSDRETYDFVIETCQGRGRTWERLWSWSD